MLLDAPENQGGHAPAHGFGRHANRLPGDGDCDLWDVAREFSGRARWLIAESVGEFHSAPSMLQSQALLRPLPSGRSLRVVTVET